jgi:anti-sigma-K factor RskA
VTETDGNELDALAGEYVLGTLDGNERRAAEARLVADPAFAASVAAWERRLQPLSAREGASPPAHLYQRILGRLDAIAPPMTGNVVSLHRSVRRWRVTSAIIGAAAAVLAGVVVFDRLQPAQQTEFVAVLTAEGAKPAFVATIDVARGTISIRSIAGAAPADRSYELWAVPADGTPRSLGLVEAASFTRNLDAAPASDGLTLAISLEPKGGSPTGAPTGPVVFSGELVATD